MRLPRMCRLVLTSFNLVTLNLLCSFNCLEW